MPSLCRLPKRSLRIEDRPRQHCRFLLAHAEEWRSCLRMACGSSSSKASIPERWHAWHGARPRRGTSTRRGRSLPEGAFPFWVMRNRKGLESLLPNAPLANDPNGAIPILQYALSSATRLGECVSAWNKDPGVLPQEGMLPGLKACGLGTSRVSGANQLAGGAVGGAE